MLLEGLWRLAWQQPVSAAGSPVMHEWIYKAIKKLS